MVHYNLPLQVLLRWAIVMHFKWLIVSVILFSNTMKAADTIAIDFSLDDIQTNLPVSLSDYQGKVIYLDFWASWCTSCAKALPLFNLWRDEFGENFIVLSVNVDENKSDGLAMAQKLSLKYPILYDGNLAVATLYQVTALPISFIIDGKGVIKYKHIGFKEADVNELKSKIQSVIQNK